MRHIAYTLIGLSLMAQALAQQPGSEPAGQSRITQVVVYAGLARVTREKDVQLPAGHSLINFGRVPAWLQTASIRLAGDASDIDFGTWRLVDQPVSAELRAELAEARQALAGLTAEQAGLQAQVEVLETANDHLHRLMPWRLETVPEESQPRSLSTAELQEVANLTKAMEANRLQVLGIRRKLADLEPRLGDAAERVEELQRQSKRPQRELLVAVEATAARQARLGLSYLVSGACWYPSHDLHLESGSSLANLRQAVIVHQVTGEDWEGVALQVETRPVEADTGWQAMAAPETVSSFEAALRRSSAALQGLEAARLATSQAASQPATVHAMGLGARVSLGASELSIEPRYRVDLTRSPLAAAHGESTWTSRQPLLPGAYRVFRDGQQVASGRLGLTLTGGTVHWNLGVVTGIRVDRVLDRERLAVSHQEKRTQRVIAYRLLVTHDRPEPVTLTVVDHVPKTAAEATMSLLSTTPPAAFGRDGALTWQLRLEAEQTTALSYSYLVTHPLGQTPPGIPE